MKSTVCGRVSGALRGLPWALLGPLALACAAIFPEISTPLKTVPPGGVLEPPPPKEILYIAFKEARIPKTTRDGRRWDEVGNGAPDALAVIYIGDKELMRTHVQSNTFNPTWPHSPKKNYEVPMGSVLRVELWEENAVVNSPICIKEIRNPHEQAMTGEVELMCSTGARVNLELSKAKAKYGLGLFYELRTDSVAVTRTVDRSPAARANLQRGDLILSINGKATKGMSEAALRTLINANSAKGLALKVKTKLGEKEMELKDGPIYTLKELKE